MGVAELEGKVRSDGGGGARVKAWHSGPPVNDAIKKSEEALGLACQGGERSP